MTTTYTPMIDPLGTAPRLALVLIFVITSLIALAHLAPLV
jgi:hypothetical protein